MKRVKRRYFKKNKAPKYTLEGYMRDTGAEKHDPGPKPVVPRILLSVFAMGLIGYVLTYDAVRIDVEVDLSNWQAGTTSPDAATKAAQMNVLANALMNELIRQGVTPKAVEVNASTISITAPKAPITGNRLGDMIDNIKDCQVGAFEWEGSSIDVDMLQNTASCDGLFEACHTSVGALGQTQLNVALTEVGRTHFETFQNTMVFVQAAYPIAMIDDYRLAKDGKLVIKSKNKTARMQQRELSSICDAMQNRDRLEGVAFKDISTKRIGLTLPGF